MSRKIKVDAKICASCCYHMGFGSQPGKEQKDTSYNGNIACNYMGITGYSRIFQNGKMAYAPHLCDKFSPGDSFQGGWTSENMTEWKQEEEKQRLWKELENANNSSKY